LLNASARAGDIYERIKRIGVVKLVVVSGIFVGEWESRIDLLVVADRAREASLEKYMRILESEIGREIRYTLLTTQEFFYRLNMNDHLLRDVLDYTHRIMFDRLDIGLK
jgi:NifB/MoaA-like Fe-S oxidoreductase